MNDIVRIVCHLMCYSFVGFHLIMAVQCYNVPVILPDLRREESLVQVTDALEYLEAVAVDIFNRISNRVGAERDKLAAINERICVAQAKVDKLRSATSKATTVLSPPKYPAPKQVEPYRSMFSDVDRRMKNVRYSKRPVESRILEVNADIIIAKQNFEVFKQDVNAALENVQLRQLKQTSVTEESEGLGGLPEYLPSVASLLLFNTSDNPYKKYVYTDPLSGHVKTTTRDQLIEQRTLDEAPKSILTGEELGRYQGASNVTYRPKLDALPELDVPNVLNLPNIADDVLYSADHGPSIAPSLALTLDLPEIEPSAASDLPPPPPGEVNLPPISDAPPPPPPPPPPTAPNVELPSLDLEAGAGMDDEEEPAMSEDNPRADLMRAIRQAGGTKNAGLKKATERRMERKKIKEEEDTVAVGSGGGDLMSDLRSALFRRRKGISGKQGKDTAESETHDVGGGSMMNKVSAMIPTPGEMDDDDSGSGSDTAGNWEDTI